jgi:hypothetical protein
MPFKKIISYDGKKKLIQIIYSQKFDSNLIQARVWPEILGTSCWLSGYRHLCRKIYEFLNGKINNPELEVCHKCDCIYGNCINPAHLFLGTHKENMNDAIIKRRGGMAGKRHSSETKRKMSNIRKGRIGYFTGKKHSKKTKNRISRINKNRKCPGVSEANKKRKGKKFSAMSESNKKRWERWRINKSF